MCHSGKFTKAALPSAILLALWGSASLAAESQPKIIETIEVHAQKRAQSTYDVPIAITVVSGDLLQAFQLKDTTALGGVTPNLKITQNTAEGTSPAVNIRGVGLLDYNTANTSPISFYVDDVTTGSANNQIINLFDIEQVEVLKGPQGTLFGRNSTGGALIIQSKMPEDNLGGYVRLGVGNNEREKVEGALNLPLSDSTAMRFAFSRNDYEYSTNNLYAPSPAAGLTQDNYRLIVTSELDDLDVTFKLHHEDWEGIVMPVGSIGIIANPLTGELCPPSAAGSTSCYDAFGFNDGSNDFHDVMVNNDTPHETDGLGGSLKLDWQLKDDLQLVSVTSINTLDRYHGFNCDGSPANLCEGYLGLENEVFTQELRLHQTLGDHHLTAGIYYTDEDIEQDNGNDILRDLWGTPLWSVGSANFLYDNELTIKALAVFAQLDYAVSADTTVTVGLRYTDEATDYHSVSHLEVPLSEADLVGIVIPNFDVSGTQDDEEFSGKLAINHKYSDSHSVYASINRGFKAGGYNAGFLTNEAQALVSDYGPEKLTAYEVGSKLALLDQRMMLSLSAFYYDYGDQQVFINQAAATPGAPPMQLLENVGESTVYGAEVEVLYRPTAALKMQLGVGYLPEANFDEFVDPLGNVLTDNRLPFTSEWNVGGLVNYHVEFGGASVVAQLSFDYQSEFYFDQNESPYAKQDAYTLWDANVSYSRDSWQLSLWGKNLTDEEYSHLKFDLSSFLGMVEDFKGEGRLYGLEFTYTFR